MSSYYSTRPSHRGRATYNRKHASSPSRGRGKAQKQYIDPSKFVQVATAATAEAYIPLHRFDDFAVDPLIKHNIAAKGFMEPSPIQDQTIPLALQGNDVIGVANTGTGKTAAFGIPILHQLITNRGDKVLIMAPTRELAQQIDGDFRSYARGSGLLGTLLIGGVGITPQIRELKQNPQIIIGTPGRIKDHIERGTLQLQTVNKVVLDEVDRMLDMGFINDIRRILQRLPDRRQSMFFSATVDSTVAELIKQFSTDPITVTVKVTSSSENVHQDVINYGSKDDQISKLHDTLIKTEVEKIIIFDETQRSVERLNRELIARGFTADAIHGGKSQGQRKRALDKFKRNEINILVATDVAARGIDVADVTHVINYSLPQSYDDYIHRIGRAGRAGRIGHAYTFVSG
jgi:ATP-dependent RNA helicase RhlE